MMNLFRRKKAPEPEPEAVPEDSGDVAAENSYQPWSPDDDAPPPPPTPMPMPYGQPLVMQEPQADAAELEAIKNAGSIEAQVTAALKKVYDPEIPVDIYEMGLVYGVEVSEEKDVAIQMTLTSPGCPVAEQMPGMVEHAVQHFVEGVRGVEVEIVWDPPWTPDRMSEAAQLELGFI